MRASARITAADLDALRIVSPALAIGGVCVVAGGLLAAVTASHPAQPTTWASAYLVLVAGASQVALAACQALLAHRPVPRPLLLTQVLAWNAGNVAVLGGTLSHVTALVDLGGILLVIALAIAGGLTLRPVQGRTVTLRVFRGLVALLVVSIPVGLWLARLGAS
ncbi:MAG: hypothetical protein ABI746_12920 [Dermatophilaceae bacterium]